jgi:hypothetical protein
MDRRSRHDSGEKLFCSSATETCMLPAIIGAQGVRGVFAAQQFEFSGAVHA